MAAPPPDSFYGDILELSGHFAFTWHQDRRVGPLSRLNEPVDRKSHLGRIALNARESLIEEASVEVDLQLCDPIVAPNDMIDRPNFEFGGECRSAT